MSIQSESRKAGPYLGDGTNTLFTFDFKIFKADELLVVYTDPEAIERVLVLNTDYSVSLNANQDSAPGGNIRTSFAPPVGYRVTMTSAVPNLQEMVLTNSGGFYPVLLNKALDKLTILVQQNTVDISRAVKVTLSTDKTPDELLASIFDSAHQANLAEAEAVASAQRASDAATKAEAVKVDTRSYVDTKYTDITAVAKSYTDSTAVATLASAKGYTDSTAVSLPALRNQSGLLGLPAIGSAPSFAIINAVPYSSILDGTRINAFFAENGVTGSNTLSIDGLSGPLVQMGLDGVEAPAVIVAGMFADIVATSYRGNIKYHVINPIRPPASRLVVTSTGAVQIPFAWRGQMLRVTLIGGGGGGGAGSTGGNALGGGGGGGGGAGELIASQFSMPANQSSLYAVIGSGGVGANAGVQRGGNGGATLLYDRIGGVILASASGGGGGWEGGSRDPSSPKSYGGPGGTGGGGGGGAGGYVPGYTFGVPGNGGSGAASGFGRGGDSGQRSGVDNVPGGAGGSAQANTGAGGGGGGGGLGDPTPSAGGAGGDGGSGLIIIELF